MGKRYSPLCTESASRPGLAQNDRRHATHPCSSSRPTPPRFAGGIVKLPDSCNRIDRFRANVLAALALCFAAGHPLSAQEHSISQMLHKSWLGRDGAPQEINALAQTPDGTLWIGSTGGLFSFDGIAFTPFQSGPGEPSLPSNAR